MEETGLHASANVPTYVTTDRGSNILSAINNASELRSIPCHAHITHRAVLSAIDTVAMKQSVAKVVKMASSFSKSVPRSSAFS